jgi:hypothetical protein
MSLNFVGYENRYELKAFSKVACNWHKDYWYIQRKEWKYVYLNLSDMNLARTKIKLSHLLVRTPNMTSLPVESHQKSCG